MSITELDSRGDILQRRCPDEDRRHDQLLSIKVDVQHLVFYGGRGTNSICDVCVMKSLLVFILESTCNSISAVVAIWWGGAASCYGQEVVLSDRLDFKKQIDCESCDEFILFCKANNYGFTKFLNK